MNLTTNWFETNLFNDLFYTFRNNIYLTLFIEHCFDNFVETFHWEINNTFKIRKGNIVI